MRLRPIAGIVAAFLFAALVPTFIVLVFTQSFDLAAGALGIAIGHVVFVGLPFFLILRQRRRVNAVTSIAAGFVAGIILVAIFTLPFRPGSSSSFNNVPLIVDGMPTLAGWLAYVQGLVLPGLLGALAGFVCWLILKLTGNVTTTVEATPHDPQGKSHWNVQAFSGISLAIVGAILTGFVFAIPSIKKDRTCHNLFRDRSHLAAGWRINLQVRAEEWPSVTKQIEDFGAAHVLSLRNSSKTQPGAFPPVLNLSLCSDQGVNIIADSEQRAPWNSEIMSSGVVITVHDLHHDPNWLGLTRDLVARLESAWPGKVKFMSGDRFVPRPKEMQ
jgi:hypothetical protein